MEKEISNNLSGQDSAELLESLGFTITDRDKITYSVGRIEGRYAYHNAEGQVVYEVVRYGPDKTFRQRSLHGEEWKWTMEGVEKVLYNLPEVLQAHKDATIWVVEGEKDADNLRKQGLVATCNVGGAGKWRQEYCEALRDRIVVVIPDNDVPGQRHAGDIDRSLQGIARSVTVLNLPNLPEKGDVTDWLAINGNDAERLCQIADDLTVLKSNPIKKKIEDLYCNRNLLRVYCL